jgi:surface protein
MFMNYRSFNDDISNWDVSSVMDMRSMFQRAYKFNQSLNNWNIDNVQDFYLMFAETQSFNTSLSTWAQPLRKVSKKGGMLYQAEAYNQPPLATNCCASNRSIKPQVTEWCKDCITTTHK